MGFFSLLFRRPVIIEDEYFGRLVLEGPGQYGAAHCFHASQVYFSPVGTTVECMIDVADISGPTAAQRTFFQRVEQAYLRILPAIIAVVENDSRLLAAGTPFVNFASTHQLAGISIPEIHQAPVSWDIWFEPVDPSHWGYTVQVDMVDDVPQAGIGISA